jgi:PAS domain S-box-containing protein
MEKPVGRTVAGSPLPRELRQSEVHFRLLVQAVQDYAIFVLDPNGIVSSWNEGAVRTKGYKADEIIGQHFSVFYTPEDRANGRPELLLEQAIQMGHVEDQGWRVRKDGSRFWADVVITPIYDSSGNLIQFTKITRDLTERREADATIREKQKQIVELQKLEAVGRLAGGIAHDFNNLIAGISGCAEVLLNMVKDAEAHAEIQEIQKVCERAATLTRQLMAFSRRQVAVPRLVDINKVIGELEKMTRRLMNANIDLTFEFTPQPCLLNADVSQLEQILLNLILNARDAMPQGGRLKVRTDRVTLDACSESEEFEIQSGEYIMLVISDTGMGMSPDVRSRIFEPFFTTKEFGKGTGLGLATVYGIVKQNNGGISVFSAPGLGTVMKVLMPAAPSSGEPSESSDPRVSEGRPVAREETILVVEDDTLILRNTARALEAKGYRVLSAASADEATRLFQKLRDKIRLVITDVIMPGVNGRQLAETLHKEDPNLPILFMSGYTADVMADHGIFRADIPFLEKPFSSMKLYDKVRELLDRPGSK